MCLQMPKVRFEEKKNTPEENIAQNRCKTAPDAQS